MRPGVIIFTDGSLRVKEAKHYAGYGVVILNPKTGKYITTSGTLSDDNESIVYCEAWAIYRAFQYLSSNPEMLKKNRNILVVTDNKINVQTFNVWIKYVWDTSNWFSWKRADKKTEVRNQALYRRILRLIDQLEVSVRFVHIPSHTKSRDKSREDLKKCKVVPSEDNIELFSKMNNLADKLASDETAKLAKSNFIRMRRKRLKGGEKVGNGKW